MAFLNLVKTEYWHYLEIRDIYPGSREAEVLFTSISIARSEKTGELMDFHYVLPYIVLSEEDIESGMGSHAAAVLETKRNSIHGTFTKSVTISDMKSQRTSGARSSGTASMGKDASLKSQPSELHFKVERLDNPIDKGWTESTAFTCFMSLCIILNGIYIAVEEDRRNAGNDRDTSWFVIEVVFTTVFTVECICKLYFLGYRYFFDGWNCFDFLLVLLGIFGIVVSAMAIGPGDGVSVSNEARIVRLARVMRVFRLLRLFRLVRFIMILKAKLNAEEMSFEVAEHMHKMTMLTCFIRGHLTAQKEFFTFFCGLDEQLNSVEVARCMLQSQTFVYMAICLAVKEMRSLNREMLHQVNCVRESKEMVEAFEAFVISVYDAGVFTGREAEAVLHPLHHHIKECMDILKDTTDGYVMETVYNSPAFQIGSHGASTDDHRNGKRQYSSEIDSNQGDPEENDESCHFGSAGKSSNGSDAVVMDSYGSDAVVISYGSDAVVMDSSAYGSAEANEEAEGASANWTTTFSETEEGGNTVAGQATETEEEHAADLQERSELPESAEPRSHSKASKLSESLSSQSMEEDADMKTSIPGALLE
jgi:hypothetical protein